MKSIIQEDTSLCYLCQEPAQWDDPLDTHHVFGGALRAKSDKLGLVVKLHHSKCHIFGGDAVHQNADVNLQCKQQAQEKAMETYGWTVEQWRAEFYKNYLED